MTSDDREVPVNDRVVSGLQGLSETKLRMILSVVDALQTPAEFSKGPVSNLTDLAFVEVMGNFLLLHHALHEEPLSKKPFEYIFRQCLAAQGHDALLNDSPGGNTHDVIGGGYKWSLKTEAAKGISPTQIKIEKLMEARWIRECVTPASCAEQVRDRLPRHMAGYDRIMVLRAFSKPAATIYELEEIPTDVLRECFEKATPDMFTKSVRKRTESPSFGADFYLDASSSKAFRILLDSSVEKIRLWYSTKHSIQHGRWVVPRIEGEQLQPYTNVS